MKFKTLITGIVLYGLYSFSSVIMKFASVENKIELKLVDYFISILILGFFSIIWQKILKTTNLSKAYFFKGTTLIWGLLFGIIFFKEKFTINMIFGIMLTILGIFIVLGEKENE